MACFRLPRFRRARADASATCESTDETSRGVVEDVEIRKEEATSIKTIRRVPRLNPLSLRIRDRRESAVESQNCDETTKMSTAATFLQGENMPIMKQNHYGIEKSSDLELSDLGGDDETLASMSRSDTEALVMLGIPFHSPVMGKFVFPYPPTHRHAESDPKPGVHQNSSGDVENCGIRLRKPRRVLNRRGQYSLIPSPSTEISLLILDEGQTHPPIPFTGSSNSTSIDEETSKCYADGILPPPSLSHSSHSSDSSLHGVAAGLAPGCTAPTGSRHWRLTNSTLMAYNSMRGPFREAGRDVYCWAERCQKLNLLKVVMDEGEGTYDDILADVNSLYHSEQPSPDDHPGRKDVFCLPRAPYDHIYNPATSQSHDAPATESILAHNPRAVQYENPQIRHRNLHMDFENWGYSDQGDNNIEDVSLPEDEFVISDDEGHPDDGRISPCTFRLFTQNCRRRCDTHQIIGQVLQNYQPTNLRLETIGPLGVEHQAPRFPGQYYPFSSGSSYACEDEDEQGADLIQMAKIITIEHWVFTGYWPKFSDEVAYV